MKKQCNETFQDQGAPAGSVEVVLHDVTTLAGSDSIRLLMLTDLSGKRQMSIFCDKATERDLMIRKLRRVDCKHRLPEVLCSLVPNLNADHFFLQVHAIEDGVYQVQLVNRLASTMIPIRITDAVLLAQVASLHLFVDRGFFEQQSAPYDPKSKRVALPMNIMSMKELRERFARAVAEEKYEDAAHLKKEIARRHKPHDPEEERP